MKILVTGAAGFIGAAVCQRLLKNKDLEVIGLDNINDYYDVKLKYSRLSLLGINREEIVWYKYTRSSSYPAFQFVRMNLEDKDAMQMLFANGAFDYVVHLGAQAGVRYSIDHPHKYIESNIDGFINILEGCRHNKIKHLVYASSSSVYGLNGHVPFSEHDSVNHPVSLYAATKKSNELMAHVYSHLYDLPTTGLRFFTVYGPWGRPDMSPYLFIDAIINERPIKVFNNGDMKRDFTFVDDIVEALVRIIDNMPDPKTDWDKNNPDPATSSAPYRIYNIGNSHPTSLSDYIRTIEKIVGKEAKKEMLPMQPGDVYQTYADSSELMKAIDIKPAVDLESGLKQTVEWYYSYNQQS